jgi:hypothetical protein
MTKTIANGKENDKTLKLTGGISIEIRGFYIIIQDHKGNRMLIQAGDWDEIVAFFKANLLTKEQRMRIAQSWTK